MQIEKNNTLSIELCSFQPCSAMTSNNEIHNPKKGEVVSKLQVHGCLTCQWLLREGYSDVLVMWLFQLLMPMASPLVEELVCAFPETRKNQMLARHSPSA